MTGLILAGHGSHISGETAGIVWREVDRLRKIGAADEISAAFWKEMPAFSSVLNGFTSADITIVPLFTASGYFTNTIIPNEMGLIGARTVRDGRLLRYTQPIGEHRHFIAAMIQRRVRAALITLDVPAHQVGVALIGHGTRRDPNSRATTLAQADGLRALGIVGAVTAVFLDDTPSIPDAYTLLDTRAIIAVPNFLALGSHTTVDVPTALGLPKDETRATVRGRMVIYTEPMGGDEMLTEAILDLARDAGMPPPSRLPEFETRLPTRGRSNMTACLDPVENNRVGQVVVGASQVTAGDYPAATLDDLTMLRDYVRTRPAFRPLATADDLPGGWQMAIRSPLDAHAVIETIYPGMTGTTFAFVEGTAVPVPLPTLIARQVGAYRIVEALTPEQVDGLVEQVCGGCILCPLWHSAHQGSDPSLDSTHGKPPCLEACNWWLSRALQTLRATDAEQPILVVSEET
ncbi:MAG: CbiX/SirB N-terminal domain-containing protein [Chloroflexota bacterium]|nr:CbiX/SirB N-terminal domain-containing protein [Chloroflexota bacterium]